MKTCVHKNACTFAKSFVFNKIWKYLWCQPTRGQKSKSQRIHTAQLSSKELWIAGNKQQG